MAKTAKQKLSNVVSVTTEKFENLTRRTNEFTIQYMQEHRYVLDCKHTQSEVVHAGKRPKFKMKCKACEKARS